ncbi:unnamed protein product [Diatraea saccharalis]|uniref:Uncharacterized protein n=1 Tax=Diatraea saccharalis TaxID=40085 RepID=A0A9N9WF29_9NEOP|nr:unnamed protein product [Diatraea saccharalis]
MLSSTKKKVKSWKTKARTGGTRRKILQEYNSFMTAKKAICKTQEQQQKHQECSSNNGVDSVPFFIETNIIRETYSSNQSDLECESDLEQEIEDSVKQSAYREKISMWAIEQNITHSALRELANITNELIPNVLPSDPRTILSTPREVNIKTIEGGHFFFNK